MGTLVAVFCENRQTFQPVAGKYALDANDMRRVLASKFRYCLGDNYFYVPASMPENTDADRFCWARDREFHDLNELNKAYAAGERDFQDVRIGNTYTKRRREHGERFEEVESFVSRELIDGIRNNPDAIHDLGKDDFESLCAELFVKRGFEVDLFRGTKDGGIDFLAVNSEEIDPLILAVQCKQPDTRIDKPRRSLGRPVVQQIYGAAKAWDLSGAVAISGAKYSREAAQFASNKPDEMFLYNDLDLHSWIEKYRWNEDE